MAANYRGERIPLGYGIVIPFVLLGGLLLTAAPQWLVKSNSAMSTASFLCFLIAFAGWMDDRCGSHSVKGLSGHWLAFYYERKVTTGAVKALIGLFCASLSALAIGGGLCNMVLNTVLIALSINLINLLDLRPGRALKGFWLLVSISFLIGRVHLMYEPVAGGALAVTLAAASVDFSGRAMMGDTGSNSLGYVAGVLLASSLPFTVRLPLMAGMVALHIYAESVSLTYTIHKNKWLRTLDEWGRQP